MAGIDSEPSPQLRPVTPVTIIADRLVTLRGHLAAGKADGPEFAALLAEAHGLAAGLEDYLVASTSQQSQALANLAAATRGEDWQRRHDGGATSLPLEGEMLSGHVEGQFLKMLVAATDARSVLEIGLFTGYSALAMAEALPDDGRLVACEIDRYAADFARTCFDASQHGCKIEVRVGPAADTLGTLADEKQTFDFVFIDADKGGYWNYLNTLVERSLLADNALICVDNTLMQGAPYANDEPGENGAAIARFNAEVAADKRFEQVLIPLRDGVTLIRLV